MSVALNLLCLLASSVPAIASFSEEKMDNGVWDWCADARIDAPSPGFEMREREPGRLI